MEVRLIFASNFNRIQARFNMARLVGPGGYKPSYNIAPGDKAYVITNNQTREMQPFEFGLRGVGGSPLPFVRAEGDRNKGDDPYYTGAKAIFLQPGFKNIIRSQRCLVLADAFVVGVGSQTPYLVYLQGKIRPFSFAGVWNIHQEEFTGDEVYSFAIITTVANRLVSRLGYPRMPVILLNEDEGQWLRIKTPLSEILNMLNPYPANLMNAYPISPGIAGRGLNDISLVRPVGEPVYQELKGGRLKRKPRALSTAPKLTLAEQAKLSGNSP